MKKSVSLILAAAVVSMSLSSCGADVAADTASPENTAQSALSDTLQSTAEAPTSPAPLLAEAVPATAEYSDSEAVHIDLSDSVLPDGVKQDDGGVKIKKSGVYLITGKLKNGAVTVDTDDGSLTRLILNGAGISCSDGAAIKIKKDSKVEVFLPDGSSTVISGGSETDDAALLSKSEHDLTIQGGGSLTVNGIAKHGIESAGAIAISDCALSVTSRNVGINGKSDVNLRNASVTVNSGTDGIRACNDKSGAFTLDGGNVTLTSEGDGVQSLTGISINGDISITAGGGSGKKAGSDSSRKGLKTGGDIAINGGNISIDSSDDAIHSNGNIAVNNGVLTLSTGDDGIHADTSLKISGGEINIAKSYEGLESAEIDISGGNILIRASDDGINAAGGKDSSGNKGFFGGKDMFSQRIGSINISGGYIFINADGDGIDSNDTIAISGGVTLISGPTSSMDSAFDYETSSSVSGGVLIALGSSQMSQGITEISGQGYILYNTDEVQSEGTSIALRDKDGNALAAFLTDKRYSSILITTPDIKDGEYDILAGAEISGADSNGFARNTSVTGGTVIATVTVENGSYSNGSFGGFGDFGGGGFGGFGGFGGGKFDKDFDKNFDPNNAPDFDKNFDPNSFDPADRPDFGGGRGDRESFDPANMGDRPEPPQGGMQLPELTKTQT